MERLDRYKGVFPAFYACYEDDGEISPTRVREYAKLLVDKGVKGLYVGGSSGECIYQTVQERQLVLENVMAAVGGRATIIAHIAAPSTRDSILLAKHAQDCGADAIAAIPPIYFRLPEHAIAAYWLAMADAVSLDFIIYNIPQTTGYTLSKELFVQMRKHPRVIGVKNSSPPVLDIQQFRALGGKDCILFNGPDEQFTAGRLMGADSGIGGTYGVMPELFLQADRHIRAGEFEKAMEIQTEINEIIMLMCSSYGSSNALSKEILRCQGINIGEARLPLAPLTQEDKVLAHQIAEKIKNAVGKFQ